MYLTNGTEYHSIHWQARSKDAIRAATPYYAKLCLVSHYRCQTCPRGFQSKLAQLVLLSVFSSHRHIISHIHERTSRRVRACVPPGDAEDRSVRAASATQLSTCVKGACCMTRCSTRVCVLRATSASCPTRANHMLQFPLPQRQLPPFIAPPFSYSIETKHLRPRLCGWTV